MTLDPHRDFRMNFDHVSGLRWMEELEGLISRSASVDLLISYIQSELLSLPYELVAIGTGRMFRTRPHFADAVRALPILEIKKRLLPKWRWPCCVLSPIINPSIVQAWPKYLARRSIAIILPG